MFKKTVVTFGLISGVLSSLMMLFTVPFLERTSFEYGHLVGYTAIVLSFLLVFFGIRSYREQAGGTLTFARGFQVGILITLISCVFYVLTWQVVYFKLAPGFADKYQAYAIDQKRKRGASEQEIQEYTSQIERFKVYYENPFFNAAITLIEPFPVGLVITLVSAGVLRRRDPSAAPSSTPSRAQVL